MTDKKCTCIANGEYSKKLLNVGIFMDSLYSLGFRIDDDYGGNSMTYYYEKDDDDAKYILIFFNFDSLEISNSDYTIGEILPYKKTSLNKIKKIINDATT